MNEKIEVMVSFDTTGSMYPCATQVRRNVQSFVQNLFGKVNTLRMGIIAHGDYCDAGSTYVTRCLPLTTDKDRICKFVREVGQTNGGDSEECYELVLHELRTKIDWTAGAKKIIILIADDLPHRINYAANRQKLDWRNEIALLNEAGIQVYAVQALGRSYATGFYREMAAKTSGQYLQLDQFNQAEDMITASCLSQVGNQQLQDFETEVRKAGRLNRSMDRMFSTLLGRKTVISKHIDLEAVPPSRFQVLYVDTDQSIQAFVLANGLTFNKGRGFYEFSKTETVQENKEVVLVDNITGDMFSGAKAREMIGLPFGIRGRIKPATVSGFTVFVQSTSCNRVLKAGTRFLYEVEDWDR